MKLQAPACTFMANESWRRWFFCVLFKNIFFKELFQATSIYYTTILVILHQVWKWVCIVTKLWKLPSRKTYKNFGNLQGRYIWRSLVIAKPFFAVRNNPTYDSEASDLMKLYFETSDSESSRFFGKIVNALKPLVIFARELHRGCLPRF